MVTRGCFIGYAPLFFELLFSSLKDFDL